MTGQYLLLMTLILLSGFFSSAETALFSISRARARYLAKKGDRIYLLIKKIGNVSNWNNPRHDQPLKNKS